jgi:ribosome biogenesis GTPase
LSNRDALTPLGWDEGYEQATQQYASNRYEPARVAEQHKGSYGVLTASGELRAEVSGRLRHFAPTTSELPVVGDWVLVDRIAGERKAVIHHVLPRRTSFTRKVAGEIAEEQVLAANVDVYLIVGALDSEFNLRRMERYLTMAWEGGGEPVIVLTKADLCDAVEMARLEVEAVAPAVPVHTTSNVTGEGFESLAVHLAANRTAVLLGSSGVGKSTIVNRMIGRELQLTNELRVDGKGRHTTTRRELIILPGGGLIIDTPGIRELQLWDAGEGLDDAFRDIADLSLACKFSDCAHDREPGCAVKGAVEGGVLAAERLASYRKLARELAWLERKRDKRAASQEARRWRKLNADARARARLR